MNRSSGILSKDTKEKHTEKAVFDCATWVYSKMNTQGNYHSGRNTSKVAKHNKYIGNITKLMDNVGLLCFPL